MNNPTDEQIKEFWEWCGFTLKKISPLKSDEPYFVTHRPDGEQYDYWIGYKGEGLPVGKLYPPIDLNNLFKYAVPKLTGFEMYTHAEYTTGESVKYYKVKVQHNKKYGVGDDTDPALALFWAIWEVIKGTK